jgi:hypothetical protein
MALEDAQIIEMATYVVTNSMIDKQEVKIYVLESSKILEIIA